jgi:DNA transformation protein and related proteins
MSKNDSYFQFIQEKFQPFPGISFKKMFGGMGLYKNGIVFGMIIQGELYFKADEKNQEEFKSRDSHPFTYQSRGKEVTLPYWLLPEEILENGGELEEWIEKSYEVGVRRKK